MCSRSTPTSKSPTHCPTSSSRDSSRPIWQVLLLIEHSSAGSAAVLLERRTGALMGDISMEDYGCVAICPLWLGGTVRVAPRAGQGQLAYVVGLCASVHAAHPCTPLAPFLPTPPPRCTQAKQNNLYVLHTCNDVVGSTRVRDGLWLGGWADAAPRVSDYSLSESRFKFFLGAGPTRVVALPS